MKRFVTALAAISLLFAASAIARAQATGSKPDSMTDMKPKTTAGDSNSMMMAGDHAPPPIMQVETDDVKPYDQVPYDKIAAEYGPVAAKAKLPGWLALEALSGPPRAMYFFPYNSFEEMQSAEDVLMKSPAGAQFKSFDAAEAPYVSEVHNIIWHYRDDLSNNATGADLPHDRFWETIAFHIKPGHDMEYEDLMKVVQATYLKIGANIPWATFESEMGASDTYLVLVPMKSLKEEDEGLARDKAFMDALGDEGMHHMDEVAREAYASVEDQLWEVNPKTSYPPPDWVSANPDFWAPKAMAPMAKEKPTMTTPMKPAPKPAQ